jgi:hypothetical protein
MGVTSKEGSPVRRIQTPGAKCGIAHEPRSMVSKAPRAPRAILIIGFLRSSFAEVLFEPAPLRTFFELLTAAAPLHPRRDWWRLMLRLSGETVNKSPCLQLAWCGRPVRPADAPRVAFGGAAGGTGRQTLRRARAAVGRPDSRRVRGVPAADTQRTRRCVGLDARDTSLDRRRDSAYGPISRPRTHGRRAHAHRSAVSVPGQLAWIW